MIRAAASCLLSLLLWGGLPPPARAQEDHQHRHSSGEVEKLGAVDFPVSCNAAARERFGRAVALLHSFWYDEAEKAFLDVAAKDPSCAMAHWGVAMSLFHPIWAAANPAAGPSPEELQRGREAIRKAKALPSTSERESDYLAAVDAFYGPDPAEYATRALAFEKAMAEVHRKHAGDREAGVFYALALLGNAPPGDKSYARQKQAAEILNKVLPDAPEHPGVAHYLIHSFDYPKLAELALPAARAYSKIAASSPHALHMPSHIFTRLALWDDSIASNQASAETARRHVEKTRPGASSFDELHALDYLAYAFLQQGQDARARQVLDQVTAVSSLDVPNFAAAYALAAVPARDALERRQWRQAAALSVGPKWFPWSRFSYAEAIVHFARAIGGARGGSLATAQQALQRLEEIRKERLAAKDAYWAEQLEIQRLAAAAWIAQAENKADEALRLMRAAADLEDTTEKHPVTPGAVLPARELLGDMLLARGEAAQALKEYEDSLLTAPGRFNSLAGGVRAAAAAGDDAKARELYARLDALCLRADDSRPELRALRKQYAALQ
jgi:hypothetical protein